MTLTKNITLKAAFFALALAAFLGCAQVTRAATSDFSQPCVTSPATTTVVYMTPGNATTTLSCPIGAVNRLADNTVILHLQIIATSTGVINPQLNFRVEESRGGIDWYPTVIPANSTLGTTPGTATSTMLTTDPYNSFSVKVSTSTVPANDFGGSGTATRIMYSFRIPAPEPYVRIKISSPTGGGNIGLWASLYGKLAQ